MSAPRDQALNISVNDVNATTTITSTSSTDITLRESQASRATGYEEPSIGKYSNPSLDKIKEGSMYADGAIRKLISRVLNEDIPVVGISQPLSQIDPPTNDDEIEKTTDASTSGKVENNLLELSNSMIRDASTAGKENIDISFAKEPSPRKQDDQWLENTNHVIDVDDLSSSDELIKNVNPRVAKRMRTRKGKAMLDTNPLKSNKKTTVVGPPRSWSKVCVSSKKRKGRSDNESEEDAGDDVQDIRHVKKFVIKRSSMNVPDAPLDNISFHSIGSATRWRFMYQRRVVMERELGQDALKIKEDMDRISTVGLIKTVIGL
ncbi:uncharacterized protein LOC131659310 [Vicia villosa]|uniref:uncharacterized protein LOC131659310 n=1 Tax=Vicia villosa TaxID=3911 RepID=UPI00273C9CAD|nr:uncharacterized protein LOC131659310 [Vicia villosa]